MLRRATSSFQSTLNGSSSVNALCRSFGTQLKIVEKSIDKRRSKRRLKEVLLVESTKPQVSERPKRTATELGFPSENYFETPVINLKREQTGTIKLDPVLFGAPLRRDIIYRCLKHRVLERRNADGIKPTKTVSTISGSGQKIRAQKGSGRARLGQKRAAHLYHGQKAHGRVARDIRTDIPSKVLKFGMRSLLSAKFAMGQLVVVDKLSLETHKTSDFNKLLHSYKWGNRILFVDHRFEPNVRLASQNLPDVQITTLRRMNVWDVLRSHVLVMTPAAIEELQCVYHPEIEVRKAARKAELERKQAYLDSLKKE